jgi:acetolactate synthase I/II/III large subunit
MVQTIARHDAMSCAQERETPGRGVCDATVGPGAAKLPSGLGEAVDAPVIALVSDLPTRLAAHRYRSAASQVLDQAAPAI